MATSERWIPFFEKGSHIDSQNRPYEATEEKLSMILAANKGRTVPLAIGHPKGNAPAVGWVDDFKRQGKLLFAKVKKLVPTFESEVKDGHWGKISASVTGDGLLNHIGFFGTQPTAMEGIPLVEFSAPEDAVEIAFDFSASEAYALQDVGSIFQRLRDWLIGKSSVEEADQIIPQWQIDNLKTMKPDEAAPVPTSFSKPQGGDMAKTVEQLEVELAAEKAKVAEFSKTGEKVAQLEAELKTEKAKNQVAEFSAFLTSKEMEKKVSPAMLPEMIDFMQIFAGVQTYEFSAPDPADSKKTVKVAKSPLAAFQEFSKKYLPEIITEGELATKKNASPAAGDVKAKREAAEMEFSKANPDAKYPEVVLAVSKEHPELYQDR